MDPMGVTKHFRAKDGEEEGPMGKEEGPMGEEECPMGVSIHFCV
jgi:hypothetical protein